MRLIIVFSIVIFLIGCGGSQQPSNTNINKTANVANITNVNKTNSSLETTRTPEAATTNAAPTIAPVVQAYYAALQKKDEAAVKKYLSQSAIAYWQAEMKTEKMASLVAILEDNESPVDEKREVRNEKIEGDKAVAEMKGGSLGVWTAIAFVKENGEWKFGSPKDSIALQNIPQTSMPTNSAK